jgi:hypothetical protein
MLLVEDGELVAHACRERQFAAGVTRFAVPAAFEVAGLALRSRCVPPARLA